MKSRVSKGNAGACFATQPSAELLQSIIMAWLSTVDDVTLIAIFKHFANCYVSMPIVGTCRRIFITWTRKRRQLALDEVRRLKSLLHDIITLDRPSVEMGIYRPRPHVRTLIPPLCEIENLIK